MILTQAILHPTTSFPIGCQKKKIPQKIFCTVFLYNSIGKLLVLMTFIDVNTFLASISCFIYQLMINKILLSFSNHNLNFTVQVVQNQHDIYSSQ